MENHKAFWGVPKQSSLTSEYLVKSEVEVVYGYGRLQVGATITTVSQPDDGASCGTQLNTGALQFIVSYTDSDKDIVSSCNCQPPSAYLLEYLIEGKDTYLPNLDKCWKDGEIKSPNKPLADVFYRKISDIEFVCEVKGGNASFNEVGENRRLAEENYPNSGFRFSRNALYPS